MAALRRAAFELVHGLGTGAEVLGQAVPVNCRPARLCPVSPSPVRDSSTLSSCARSARVKRETVFHWGGLIVGPLGLGSLAADGRDYPGVAVVLAVDP